MTRSLGITIVAAVACLSSGRVFGFNELGHSVIGKVAYERLTDAQRSAVHDILKHHPHYDEYLQAGRPDPVSEKEWAFLRATTWADWIRSRHRDEYHQSEWHYINFPYRPGQPIDEMPAAIEQPRNILERLPKALRMVKSGATKNSLELSDSLSAEQRRAVALTWAFHLLGDLHQPLHVIALVEDARWPLASHGDQGGNLVAVVLEGTKPVRLHSYWDGALNLPMSYENVAAVAQSLSDDPPLAVDELTRRMKQRKFDSWATESYRLAVQYAYLKGTLQLAPWRDGYNRSTPADADVPVLPEAVQRDVRRIYRQQLLVAGARLAEQLKLSL